MDTVIIYGDGNDTNISSALRRYFNCRMLCSFAGGGTVSLCGDGKLLIIDGKGFSKINADSGIIIFKNNISDYAFPHIPKTFTAVLSGENTSVMGFLRDNRTVAVTCGIGVSDTLSISSIGDDCATVSLQRQLRTTSGEINEPQDIIIRNMPPGPKYPFMCLCAALLLTRKSEGMEIVL